ncbi:hypothetical protein QYF67_18985 [Pseudomonas donghuensis]|nr:hypothetical protein [Pseudomonas donghuensis]WKY31147.1 hypothetical protein QYF67_18985 [Pseudomonas donghuensis]
MKRTLAGMIEAGEPLIQQALDALRYYHEAEAGGSSAEEIERLRLIAESLCQAVTDYQPRSLGAPSGTPHSKKRGAKLGQVVRQTMPSSANYSLLA